MFLAFKEWVWNMQAMGYSGKKMKSLNLYTQYPIIRNGDQRWALEFVKNYQFLDSDRFLILQVWVLAVS